MNTIRDLKKRLLHLFPIATVKEYFKVRGTSEEILEDLTEAKTTKDINEFAYTYFAQTRQNIYLYQLNAIFDTEDFNEEEYPIEVENSNQPPNEFLVHSLPRTTFRVLIGRTGQEVNLTFIQPVTTRIVSDILIVHFTKLVRNISSYFPDNDFPIKKGQLNDESAILAKILEYFGDYEPTPLDINRGVKHLWQADDVDCLKVLSRKSASAVMETMDGTNLFKQQYPADYKVLTQRPLEKTVFQYLKDGEYLCKEFTTEPTIGRISINQFPANETQVLNVVSEILRHN